MIFGNCFRRHELYRVVNKLPEIIAAILHKIAGKLPYQSSLITVRSAKGSEGERRRKKRRKKHGRVMFPALADLCVCMHECAMFFSCRGKWPRGHVQLGQSLDIVRLTGGAAAAAAAATAARHQQHEHHISRRTSTHRGGSSRMPRYLTADLPADVPGPTHAVPTSCARV